MLMIDKNKPQAVKQLSPRDEFVMEVGSAFFNAMWAVKVLDFQTTFETPLGAFELTIKKAKDPAK